MNLSKLRGLVMVGVLLLAKATTVEALALDAKDDTVAMLSFLPKVYVGDTVKRAAAAQIDTPMIASLIPSWNYTAVVDMTSNPQMSYQELDFESKDRYALLETGAYYISLSANFTNKSTLNLLVEPLFDVHEFYNRSLDVQLAAGYFVKNNVAVGLYGGYKLSDVSVEVSSDILQLLINSRTYETRNVSTGFSIGAFTKTFVPLEYRHRIFLVNEASLFYQQMTSLSRNVFDRGAMLSKVFQRTYLGGVKLSVGVMMFLSNNFSLDFTISPIAAVYQYNEVTNNEVLNGAFRGGAVNTIILPLDMKFSLSYFFGLDNRKNRQHINQVHKNRFK